MRGRRDLARQLPRKAKRQFVHPSWLGSPAPPYAAAMAVESIPPSSLVLADGGLLGLVALAHAREHAAMGHHGAPMVAPCPIAMNGSSDAARVLRMQALTEQAKHFGFQVLDVAAGQTSLSNLAHAGATTKQRQAAGMLALAYAAQHKGIARIIWAAHACEGESVDLDHLSWCVDLALAVSRLATLTASNAQGLVIEAPYLDVSDAQAADLGVELAAPLATCWWWKGPHTTDDPQLKPVAAREQSRWLRALSSVGWHASIERTS